MVSFPPSMSGNSLPRWLNMTHISPWEKLHLSARGGGNIWLCLHEARQPLVPNVTQAKHQTRHDRWQHLANPLTRQSRQHCLAQPNSGQGEPHERKGRWQCLVELCVMQGKATGFPIPFFGGFPKSMSHDDILFFKQNSGLYPVSP